jgi:hypothetical protein
MASTGPYLPAIFPKAGSRLVEEPFVTRFRIGFLVCIALNSSSLLAEEIPDTVTIACNQVNPLHGQRAAQEGVKS